MTNTASPRLGTLNNGFGHLKNATTLLRAFRTLHEATGATLVLAGPDYGPGEKANLWARRHKVEEGVEFIGAIDPSEVGAYLSHLDAFVHPSLEESFGMVLVEAIRSGTPVIGGRDSGAVPWVLANGRSGILADVTTVEGIAHGIRKWMQMSEDQVRSLTINAYEDACARFSVESTTKAFVELYIRAIEATRSTPSAG